MEAPALPTLSGGIHSRVPQLPWEASTIRFKLITPVELCESNKALLAAMLWLRSQILHAHSLAEHLALKLFLHLSISQL